MSISTPQVPAQSAFRRIFVTGPWLPAGVIATGYWNGKPWHTLTYPMFSRADVQRLCELLPDLTFVESRNAVRHVEGGHTEWFDAEPHVVDGKLMDLYAVGFGWGWRLARHDTVPATHGQSLHMMVRTAALEWMQALADEDHVALCAYASFLLSGYIEQRLEIRHRLDLSRFDAVLAIASQRLPLPGAVRIAVQSSEWIAVVDALTYLADGEEFNALPQQARRERVIEAMLDQLAREVGGA